MERPARKELALASLTTHHVGLEKYKSTGHRDFTHFRADRGVDTREWSAMPEGVIDLGAAAAPPPAPVPGARVPFTPVVADGSAAGAAGAAGARGGAAGGKAASARGKSGAAAGAGAPLHTFRLAAPEQLNPSFNVLYVRTQKPGVMRLPLVKLLLDTWDETVELVRPVFRFGIPESSLKDKCPYWRDDGSSLPTTPSFQMRRLQKAISSEGWGTQRAQMAGHGHGHGDHGHGGGHGGHGGHGGGGHGHGKGHHLTPFHEKEEFVENVTPWVVLGLNVAAWCYLGSSATKPPAGM
ncbi:hypothetical protein HYH02_013827 [Chlamydomonas schloesseri]|uniref:Uncharacterized protein n=1 Tax=Chlamydomonas schloesseri TaxID=2026947 RepID=A0A835SMZ6_9CHLO|nr:hypothetical protein HYH02_013827 [Chlamydomonas schloesseri]|eukprot:KAG2429999.1 hypothetical protein HYH02_013827 [Chlamydomonas schloesseri]